MGAVVTGCPAGVPFDEAQLLRWLERRRPGSSASVSARQELDAPQVLSGVYEGRTLGTPIAVIVQNQDARSQDYSAMTPRAGHADDVWRDKFGHADPRGGGRSSGRETLARVIGGAIAEMLLKEIAPEVLVRSFPRAIGVLSVQDSERDSSGRYGLSAGKQSEIEDYLLKLKSEGDSVGGVAETHVTHLSSGLGQPVFHKLKSDLAAAHMSVGAVTGFELGGGFRLAGLRGQELHTSAQSAEYGGIRGGVSTGETLVMRTAFKPTSSILDVAKRGRHDPCIVLRALPVLEAMTLLVLADHLLWSRLDRLR
jgi:chorismate synthase